jgi:hypothetical protein
LEVYRCTNPKCKAILFEAENLQGIVRKVCKCGKVNLIMGRKKTEPFQDRLGLIKK